MTIPLFKFLVLSGYNTNLISFSQINKNILKTIAIMIDIFFTMK